METNVIFLTVHDAPAKIQTLIKVVHSLFAQKETLYLLAPDDVAASYIDSLLWRTPEESFLPHTIKAESPHAFITIVNENFTPKRPSIVFNLTPSPFLKPENVKTIYEYEDNSSEEKKRLSQERFRAYRQKGWPISSLNL